MSGAFENITVADFTQVLAGPVATQQLAFLGADVIKVEPPGTGESGRYIRSNNDTSPESMSSVYLAANSGKRSTTLDLKHPRAKPVVQRLLERADVVVQNFKVGVMQRLGLDYARVKEINPSIVYCSISGYGQVGPRATAPAYDPAVQSASGMMQLVGTGDTGPLRVGFPIVDTSTGLNAAIAIMGALYRRKETGDGQHLDVAMMDSAMGLLAVPYMLYQQTGEEPERIGNESLLRSPTADVYATADGYIQITAITEPQTASLCRALDVTELLDDARFATSVARSANRVAMRAELEVAFAAKSAREWETILSAAGIPVATSLSFPEALAHPQFEHRDFFRYVTPQGFDAPLRVFNASYDASEDGPDVRSPPPAIGEHTDEVMQELGFAAGEIESLRDDGVI